jgi:hypothetical protein
VLISALTTSFFVRIADNPDVPPEVTSAARVELSGGIPFVSDADLEGALDDAGVPEATARAIVDENEEARLDGLRAALLVLALLALLAQAFTGAIPVRQPAAALADGTGQTV